MEKSSQSNKEAGYENERSMETRSCVDADDSDGRGKQLFCGGR